MSLDSLTRVKYSTKLNVKDVFSEISFQLRHEIRYKMEPWLLSTKPKS